MNSSIWLRMHGGATHFPIALVLASALFDLAGYAVPAGTTRQNLRAAAFHTLIVAALGSVGAVITGLVLSHGQLLGSGSLAKHHWFVWPAFGLVVGLAVWRLIARDGVSRRAYRIYLVSTIAAAMLMAIAGYWGGEMLLNAEVFRP